MGLSYGEKVAMEYARKNARRRKEKAAASGEKRKAKAVPVLETEPLSGYACKGEQAGLPWDSDAIAGPASELARRMEEGASNMQMLVMPPGHGKTAVAVAAMARMQEAEGGPIPFIVAAPKSVVAGGGWHETLCSYNEAHPENPVVPRSITTTDKLANVLADRRSRLPLVEELGDRAVLVLDEAHAYKNPTSKRAKALQKATCWRRLALTATPLTNDALMDTASYLIMAGLYANKTEFLNRERLVGHVDAFNRLRMYVRDWETGEMVRNEELLARFGEIRLKLAPVLYQPDVRSADAEMPNVTDVVVQLPYSEPLAADLASLSEAYRARMFESAVDLALAMTERVCGDGERLSRCVDLALAPGAVQPLVFFFHASTRAALEDAFAERGVACQVLDGAHGIEGIDMASPAPILVQYRAGAEGIEFKGSNTSVLYENQYSYSCLHQARGRNVRRGMTEPVTRYALVSQCMFDQEVYGRVAMHEELSEQALAEIAERSLAGASRW